MKHQLAMRVYHDHTFLFDISHLNNNKSKRIIRFHFFTTKILYLLDWLENIHFVSIIPQHVERIELEYVMVLHTQNMDRF
jgi:hypothetical protein